MKKFIRDFDIPLGIALFSIVVIVLGVIIDNEYSWFFVGAAIVWLSISVSVIMYMGLDGRK